MTASDRAMSEVRSLIDDEPCWADDKPNTIGLMQRLCRTAARALPASGVGVSVMSEEGSHVTAAASDARSVLVEELQFALGEGPCLEAYGSGRPVLCPDLAADSRGRWPGYGPAAAKHGVRAVFAFPLQIGTARLGAIDFYRDEVGVLPTRVAAQALTFADVAIRSLLDGQLQSQQGASAAPLDESLENQFQVYQAQGMLSVQLGVTMPEAMVRLRAHAYARDLSLGVVADAIVARRLTLENDGR